MSIGNRIIVLQCDMDSSPNCSNGLPPQARPNHWSKQGAYCEAQRVGWWNLGDDPDMHICPTCRAYEARRRLDLP